MLVDGITVDDNILDGRTQLHVAALFEPTGNSTVIKVVDGQSLIVQQQGNEFMHIVGHEVTLRVNDETAVFQDGRRQVNLYVLTQEPAFHLVITPTGHRVHRCQTLHNHSHTVGQFIDARQTAFVLLTHHHTLVMTERILTQPKGHQRDTQRVEVDSGGNLHLAVNDIVIHLGSSIHRCASLCGAVHLLVTFQHARDSEVAQHDFLMVGLAEEIVSGLDVFMYDVAIMTIGQCGSGLQSDTAELVEVTVQIVVIQRTAMQIFHQFVVAVLAVNISLTVIVYLDDHLHTDILDDAHQSLLDGEVGVIDFQHALALFTFHQKDLSLTRIVAQALNAFI